MKLIRRARPISRCWRDIVIAELTNSNGETQPLMIGAKPFSQSWTTRCYESVIGVGGFNLSIWCWVKSELENNMERRHGADITSWRFMLSDIKVKA